MSELAERLRPALAQMRGGGELRSLERLTGGASRETWLATLADDRRLIVRREMVASRMSHDLATEASALRAAHEAGVPVPEVFAQGEDFVVCAHVEGETLPRRILRDERYAGARARLAEQCGAILARIHAIDPGELPSLPTPDPLLSLRERLDGFAEDSAVFELALRELDATRPAPVAPRVVHGDFRNGNLMVGEDGVRAVLDWELCHHGDPAEDLGYLCMRAWRFGGEGRVGGFGALDDLIAGYEAAGGAPVDRARVRWWEIRATLWWGLGAMEMARPHLDGELRSVERATIGRRAREQEYDLMCLLEEAA